MIKQEVKKRIEKLRDEINRYRYAYHVLDKSLIPDAALDSLKHELYQLEQQYPEFITSDSPTQRVGGGPLKEFKKVEHKSRMLSLQDVFDNEEINDWRKRIQKLAPNEKIDYYAEIKMDGLAVSLIYKNGIFIQGSTRGNGAIGEDITQNLKTIEAIPLKLELDKLSLNYAIQGKCHSEAAQAEESRFISSGSGVYPERREGSAQDNRGENSSFYNLRKPSKEIKKGALGEIEIRGEVFMTKKVFEKLNREQKNKNEALFANPRNVAAGSLRQLNPKIVASRKLDFYAYDLITDLGQKTHEESHQLAKLLGVKVNPHNKFCKNLEEVIEYHKHIGKTRSKFDYWSDGIVVNVNDILLFKKLGVAGKAPRGSIAFKYPAEQATTTVEDIIIQIGRTGALTPVAVLSPVRVAGSTISRATLHNEDEIKRLDVRIGDTVIVQKAGDVIPDIVKTLTHLRTGKERKFEFFKNCPVCGSKIIRRKGEVAYYCANKNCFAQNKEKLYHFVSKKAFDIEHLGPKIIDKLLDEELIEDAGDIFKLKQGDLESLERFAGKSASNLIEAITNSKKISLARFIYALGIRHVGEETAFDLANYFGSLEKIKKVGFEELQNIQDIGGVMAKSVCEWFGDKKNLQLLEKLLKEVEIEKPKYRELKLKGKSFVLTGSLKTITREDAKSKIRNLGGDVSSSVSENTDFLVVGDEPGSKYDKAKRFGIRIINEREFLNLLK